MKLCGAAYSRPIPAFSPNSGPIEIFKCRPFDTTLRFEVFCGKPTYVCDLSGFLYEGGRLGWVVVMAGKGADPWADVDFDEVQEATCLEVKAPTQKNLCTFILILGGRHQSPFQLFPIVWREEARLPTGRWYRGGDEVIFLSNDQKSNIPFQQSTQPPKDQIFLSIDQKSNIPFQQSTQIFLSNGQKSNIPFQRSTQPQKIKYSFRPSCPQKTQIFCQGDGVPSNSGGAGSVDWGDRRGRLWSDWVRRVCPALC